MPKKRPHISKAGEARAEIKPNAGSAKGNVLTPISEHGYTLVERGSSGHKVIRDSKGESVPSMPDDNTLPEACNPIETGELTKPRTGAEALAFWRANNLIGTFSDRPEESSALTRKLREEAQTRQWDEA